MKFSPGQVQVIKDWMNVKIRLKTRIIKKAYTDVDFGNFLIGYVFIRTDNFVIRVIHHVNKEELKDEYAVDEGELKKEYEEKDWADVAEEHRPTWEEYLHSACLVQYKVKCSSTF